MSFPLGNFEHSEKKMTTCSPALLADTPIFRKLADQDLENLARHTSERHLIEGEFLAMQSQDWPYLLLVNTGVLKTHKVSPKGRALGAMRLIEGDIFCSPTIIDGGPLPATIEADSSCSLYLWHKDLILPIIHNNSAALWDLSALLIKRMRQASEIVEDLAFHPVASRVARLLIKENQKTGTQHVQRDLTLDEMATMIGTTPVMVCKVLSQFADQDLVKVSRTEFELIDQNGLQKIIDSQ